MTPLRTHDGSSWQQAHADDFPTGGDVFWEHARQDLAHGNLIAFNVRRNNGKQSWAVEREVECHRLIDYTDRAYELVLRSWHQNPILISRTPGPHSEYVACRDNLVIGPLRAIATSRSLTLDPTQRLDLIEANLCPQAVVDLGGRGLWLVPELQHSASFVIDARTDAEVLRSAMTDARKILSDQGREVPSAVETKSAIDQALRLASRADVDRTKIERLKRARSIAGRWDKTRLQASELEHEIRALPEVTEVIDGIRGKVSEQVRADAESAFRLEKAEAAADLRAARDEAEDLRAESKVLYEELSRADELVKERLAEISTDAAKAVSDSIMLSALGQADFSKSPGSQRSSSVPQLRRGRVFGELNPVLQKKSAAAFADVAADNSLQAVRRIHAAIVAGLVPVLIGAGSQSALAAYARVALAGRTVSVPITHDFLQPTDLLGIVAETGELARSHGDLLIAANREVSATHPGLAILDGFNRGATESYLVPWLIEPSQSIQIGPVASEALLQSEFTRSPHLAVAATATIGSTSAPVGADLWSRAVLIDVPKWSPVGRGLPELSWIPIDSRANPTVAAKAKEAWNGSVDIAKEWWQIDASVL
ncbi:MAG: hypothetical protein WBG47_13400, partial [Gordonia sp. (in: high G+C Gram-positive bacteria)]|uniref:hypothetical protein n=1 Tax=Gordonia sp. (in: high G+C Gram-positive bacteria) TaxID=84139 RepID=UPI003C751E5A